LQVGFGFGFAFAVMFVVAAFLSHYCRGAITVTKSSFVVRVLRSSVPFSVRSTAIALSFSPSYR